MNEFKVCTGVAVRCPICNIDTDLCTHFLGWTNDGETVLVWPRFCRVPFEPLRHVIVNTGEWCRVYSKAIAEDLALL